MQDRILFFLSQLRERLWVKPLVSCLLSIGAVFLARLADDLFPALGLPPISADSLEALLKILSASMLVIAVFAVGSMLSAYASASGSATPRAFAIVVADDVSQYALSIFVGSFIFSIVGLVALMNGLYEPTGRFVLFALTVIVFMVVIFGFLRWVDSIARLGRLGNTIDKVETVTARALLRNRKFPTLGGKKADGVPKGEKVLCSDVGYVQRVDIAALQAIAEANDLEIHLTSRPGAFLMPGQPLCYVQAQGEGFDSAANIDKIRCSFVIGGERTFVEDPRFGLIVLSEISSRALSPAVNDPGTALDIIGTFVRLFTKWAEGLEAEGATYDRVSVPEVSIEDMFDDAFNGTCRDGAASIEVVLRLLKALQALAAMNGPMFKRASLTHSRLANSYAQQSLGLSEERERVTQAFERVLSVTNL